MIEPMRHISIFSPEKFGAKPVNVIGAGATGSKIVMELAKLGIENIHVWDFDTVEVHNIANQLYGNQHVGKLKVDALKEIIKDFTGTEITTYNEKFVDQPLFGVVFLLTDTMSSRKEIWENSIRYKLNVDLMIETRMGAEIGRIYVIDPKLQHEIKMWEGTLCEDEVTEDSLCGSSVTVGPTAGLVAGYAVWQLIRWFAIQDGKEDRIEHEIIFAVRSTYAETRSVSI